MDILILGGTQFVGRHITRAFLDAGHSVTLFNRGRTNPDLFADEAELLTGDRDGGLEALEGRSWDACIDVNGYVPRLVRDSAALLAGQVRHYVFISTISVYQPPIAPNLSEGAPLQTLDDPTTEEITGETYGGLKVLCEEVVRELYPEAHTILRPGIVSGPWDHTDRVTYYMHRLREGGEVLLPGGPDARFQTIDGRDLAEATVASVTQPITGTYNIVADAMPWADFVAAAAAQGEGAVQPIYLTDAGFLEALDMDFERPRGGLPMLLPPDYANMFNLSNDALKAQGVTFRPITATIRDTLAWVETWPEERTWQAGLTPDEERALIDAWRARTS